MLLETEIKLLAEEMLEVDDFDENSNFKSLGLDSLDTIELILAIEEKYNIQIPDTDLPNISTFSQLIWYVNHYIEKKEKTNV
jgi:acyl carrier protein